MERLTRWVLGHSALVIAAWALLGVAGFISLQPVSDALSSEFTLPGSESTETALAIERIYGNGGPRAETPIVMVTTLPEGTTVDTPGVRREVGAAFGATADAVDDVGDVVSRRYDESVFVAQARRPAVVVRAFRFTQRNCDCGDI